MSSPTPTPTEFQILLAGIFQAAYKWLLIGSLIIYTIFALILLQQIRTKRDTLTTKLGPYIEVLVYIHFILSVGLVILAFILL